MLDARSLSPVLGELGGGRERMRRESQSRIAGGLAVVVWIAMSVGLERDLWNLRQRILRTPDLTVSGLLSSPLWVVVNIAMIGLCAVAGRDRRWGTFEGLLVGVLGSVSFVWQEASDAGEGVFYAWLALMAGLFIVWFSRGREARGTTRDGPV